MKLMTSYLEDRSQAVYLEGQTSYQLSIGPRSEVQGSGLSCVLYLIFTLDLPLIFHPDRISVAESQHSLNPGSTLYVDDNFVLVKKQPNTTLQTTLDQTMRTVQKYMKNNKLSLNKEKTQLMVLSKKPT